MRNLQNLGLGVARVRKVDRRIRAYKGMLALMRVVHQHDAAVIAQAGLLGLDELRDFRVRGVQFFQFFDVARPHSRLVQRTVIREQMLLASARPQEDKHPEKHPSVRHNYIVWGASGAARECVVRDTRRRDRCERSFAQAKNPETRWTASQACSQNAAEKLIGRLDIRVQHRTRRKSCGY